jgi:hypothetical protein
VSRAQDDRRELSRARKEVEPVDGYLGQLKELEEKATGEVQKIDSLESQPITPHIHELLYETRGELRNSSDEMQSVLAKMREFLNHPSE